jgi:hypothetical protein
VLRCSSYVWHGVQCGRGDDCPGESRFWRSVMACPVPIQERLRRWRLRSFPCGRRPYADLGVQLMGGCRAHSSRRGSVLSPCNPTASGMALQCPRWHRDGGDGRAGPMVTEETRLTGLTSRCGPGQAWNRRPSLFRGFRCPLLRVRCAGRMRVGGIVSRS